MIFFRVTPAILWRFRQKQAKVTPLVAALNGGLTHKFGPALKWAGWQRHDGQTWL